MISLPSFRNLINAIKTKFDTQQEAIDVAGLVAAPPTPKDLRIILNGDTRTKYVVSCVDETHKLILTGIHSTGRQHTTYTFVIEAYNWTPTHFLVQTTDTYEYIFVYRFPVKGEGPHMIDIEPTDFTPATLSDGNYRIEGIYRLRPVNHLNQTDQKWLMECGLNMERVWSLTYSGVTYSFFINWKNMTSHWVYLIMLNHSTGRFTQLKTGGALTFTSKTDSYWGAWMRTQYWGTLNNYVFVLVPGTNRAVRFTPNTSYEVMEWFQPATVPELLEGWYSFYATNEYSPDALIQDSAVNNYTNTACTVDCMFFGLVRSGANCLYPLTNDNILHFIDLDKNNIRSINISYFNIQSVIAPKTGQQIVCVPLLSSTTATTTTNINIYNIDPDESNPPILISYTTPTGYSIYGAGKNTRKICCYTGAPNYTCYIYYASLDLNTNRIRMLRVTPHNNGTTCDLEIMPVLETIDANLCFSEFIGIDSDQFIFSTPIASDPTQIVTTVLTASTMVPYKSWNAQLSYDLSSYTSDTRLTLFKDNRRSNIYWNVLRRCNTDYFVETPVSVWYVDTNTSTGTSPTVVDMTTTIPLNDISTTAWSNTALQNNTYIAWFVLGGLFILDKRTATVRVIPLDGGTSVYKRPYTTGGCLYYPTSYFTIVLGNDGGVYFDYGVNQYNDNVILPIPELGWLIMFNGASTAVIIMKQPLIASVVDNETTLYLEE